MGFIPRVKDGKRGFEIRVGGGTSIMPRVAPTLYEFVGADDGEYLKVTEAVMRIFDRQEWLRENRARARIKVFVDKYGIDELRRQTEEELKGDWVNERDFTLELFDHDEEANAPAAPMSYGSPNGDRSEFDRWVAANTRPQRQKGFSAVQVKVIRGDLTPEQFRGLAQVMRDSSGGYARTTIDQNLVLRWVRDESLYDVWQALFELGLGDAGADEVNDVISCPGTDSCKLGITSSMGLNQAIQERVESMGIEDPLSKRIHIKMSGCPNGCGQHHIGNIGFYGASIKAGDKTIPAYVAHIGGHYEGGEVAYGNRLKVRLPAKRVPDAVERWIRMYEAEREEGEAFNAFANRVGEQRFVDEVKELSLPVEFSLENLSHFIDWNRHETYEVVRGEGVRRLMAVALAPDLEHMSAEEVLAYMVERFHLYVACSFQKEASVIMDMLVKIEPRARFFTLDTGLFFSETYTTWRQMEERYDVKVEVYQGMSLARQGEMHGDELWNRDPDACCGIRKVAPLKEALAEVDGWISGLRREQSPMRSAASSSSGTGRTSSGRPTRSPTGRRRTSGAT